MDIIIIMCLGILVGKFLIPIRIRKFNEKISLTCTLLLIFSMGVKLGAKENFLNDLTNLGLTSFIFFLIPTLFSIILVYILTKKYMEGK